MFSRFEFVLTETALSLRRHPMMAFAAITCVAATLFVAGIVGLALLNAHHAVDNALNRVRFVVYFHPDPETTREEARAAYRKICGLPQVQSAEFVTSERAWTKIRKDDPQYARLIERNPLPDSVVIKAVHVEDIPALREQIHTWPEVHSINDAPEVSHFWKTANARCAVSAQ
jgi:cell division protein FtsX